MSTGMVESFEIDIVRGMYPLSVACSSVRGVLQHPHELSKRFPNPIVLRVIVVFIALIVNSASFFFIRFFNSATRIETTPTITVSSENSLHRWEMRRMHIAQWATGKTEKGQNDPSLCLHVKIGTINGWKANAWSSITNGQFRHDVAIA